MNESKLRQLEQGHSRIRLAIRQGTQHPLSKLTGEIVLEIRQLFEDNPELAYKDVAPEFGVSVTTIRKVVTRQSWAHI
jgi:hypothetical protein